MHPALRKGPLFTKKNIFHFFLQKKHLPFSTFLQSPIFLFLQKNTPPFSTFLQNNPIFHFFTKKTPPLHFVPTALPVYPAASVSPRISCKLSRTTDTAQDVVYTPVVEDDVDVVRVLAEDRSVYDRRQKVVTDVRPRSDDTEFHRVARHSAPLRRLLL